MKPICVPCERFMRCKKTGMYFVEGMPHSNSEPWDGKAGKNSVGWSPYKLWSGDLFECPTCKAQTIVGVAPQPIAEHYQPEFKKLVSEFEAKLLIKDC